MSDETIVRLKILSLSKNPGQITDAIGISPDKSWRVGDFRAKSIIVEKYHGWVLHSKLPRTATLDEHLESFLQVLSPCIEKIKLLSVEDKVEFSCVIYISDQTMPALNFRREIINKISELGAALDIDLYLSQNPGRG